jgi:GWxTD domain-containing protein
MPGLAAAVFAACVCLGLPTVAAARGFVLHASAFMNAAKKPSVKVTAEIPYASLVFLKENGEFRARYSIAVTVRDVERPDAVVRTGVFKGDAIADYYEETHSREKRSRPSKVFELPSGEYTIVAVLTVKNTHIRYSRETRTVVPDFLASGLGFGTPEVFFLPFTRGQRVVRWEDFDRRSELKRADSEMVGLNVLDAQPALRFELFADEGVPTPLICNLYYEVRNVKNKRVLYGRSRARLVGNEDAYVVTFDAENWQPGSYEVNLRATAEGGKFDARAKARLDLDVTHAMLAEYFDDTLEILSLIATEDELQPLATATPEMRAEEWRKFWRARDPNPATQENEALEELLERVRVASREYADHRPGWRTDRGKVYIRYGKPDKIEKTPDRTDQGEYEVWTYYRSGHTFVFFAQYAGGEYRLIEGDPF